MKKVLAVLALAVFAIGGVVFAQTMVTKIDSINVNFDSKTATIQETTGYYDNSNAWNPTGGAVQTTINEPAFDSVLNTLAQDNAFNVNEVAQVLQNSI